MEEIRIIKSSDGTFGVRQGDRWVMGLNRYKALSLVDDLTCGIDLPAMRTRETYLEYEKAKNEIRHLKPVNDDRNTWAWPGEFAFCDGCEKLVVTEDGEDWLEWAGDIGRLCTGCVHDLKQEWNEKGPECHECYQRKGWGTAYYMDDHGEEVYCRGCMPKADIALIDAGMDSDYHLVEPPETDLHGWQDGPRDPGDAELTPTDDRPGDLPQVLPQERHREAEAGVDAGAGDGGEAQGLLEAGGDPGI
jgi:hypothetical protein